METCHKLLQLPLIWRVLPDILVGNTSIYLAKLLYFAGRWVEFDYFGSEIMVRSLN